MLAGRALPEDFSEEEKETAIALICRRYGSKTSSDEADGVFSDIAAVEGRPAPNVPILLIISDGSDADGWLAFEKYYASKLSDVKILQLDGELPDYDSEADQCEDAMREFIGRLITWEPKQLLYDSSSLGGVAYPRMLTLKNGTILCAFDGNDTKGGNSVIKVYQSKDGGKTWGPTNEENDNSVMEPSDQYIYANPNMMQLKNGDVLIAYRGLSSDDSYSPRDTGIFVSVSHDNGVTWEPHSTVIKYDRHTGGVYEPVFAMLKGVPTVFYANDSAPWDGEMIGTDMNGTAHQPAVPSFWRTADGCWHSRPPTPAGGIPLYCGINSLTTGCTGTPTGEPGMEQYYVLLPPKAARRLPLLWQCCRMAVLCVCSRQMTAHQREEMETPGFVSWFLRLPTRQTAGETGLICLIRRTGITAFGTDAGCLMNGCSS